MSKETTSAVPGVKKAFIGIVALLEENRNVKVEKILDQVRELCSAKSAGGVATASHKDENGNVIAVRCSYYKLWMPTSHVAFGKKEGSATGFNSMCKEGANNFSKSQREARLAKEKVLGRVAAGEIAATDIAAELERIEAARQEIIPFSVAGMGWENLEDCLAQTPEQLDALVQAAQEAAAAAERQAAETATAEAAE